MEKKNCKYSTHKPSKIVRAWCYATPNSYTSGSQRQWRTSSPDQNCGAFPGPGVCVFQGELPRRRWGYSPREADGFHHPEAAGHEGRGLEPRVPLPLDPSSASSSSAAWATPSWASLRFQHRRDLMLVGGWGHSCDSELLLGKL